MVVSGSAKMLIVSGIDHINLQVRNLKESCDFYFLLLGFVLLEDMPESKGRIIGSATAKLALYENPNLDNEDKSGFSHVSFHINNFQDCEALCNSLGIDISYGGVVAWQKSRSIYIKDPNGYEIELSEVWGGGL
jgi:catechol 2,3-dioxygenase-like lactoylglutathione lyase family enzyme